LTRKASEVLLDLEAKLNKLLAEQSNTNNLLKVIANRLGSPQQPIMQQPVPQQPQQAPLMPGLKPGVRLENGVLVNDSPASDNEVFDPNGQLAGQKVETEYKMEMETSPKGERRGARYTNQEPQKRNVTITQKVLYPNGKNVCLARIEVFDMEGNLVTSAKTNSTGKWSAQLPSEQDYVINVIKKASASKPEINKSFEISVPNQSAPLQLKDLQ